MKKLLFCFLLLAQLKVVAQTKEFEGDIHYQHLFKFALKGIDSAEILRSFGSASNYYYKEGAYKWTFDSCNMAEEYYSSETGEVYNRNTGSREYILSKGSGQDKLLRYEVVENADTICGYRCHRIQVMTCSKSDKDDIMIRFIFYAPDLIIDPKNFKKFESYSNDEVYKITKSAFLRIEMVTPYLPFRLRMEATKVTPRSLDINEVSLPADAIKK